MLSGKGAEMTPDTLASKVDVCIVLVCTLCVFMCACVCICVCVHCLKLLTVCRLLMTVNCECNHSWEFDSQDSN